MHARRQTNCRSSEFSPAARARVALVPNDSAVRVTLPICTDSPIRRAGHTVDRATLHDNCSRRGYRRDRPVNSLAGQFGQTNYAAAKAGMIGFTKALALESAARGITVNVIAAGYTDTAMVAAVPPKSSRRSWPGSPFGDSRGLLRSRAPLCSSSAMARHSSRARRSASTAASTCNSAVPHANARIRPESARGGN